MVVRRQLLIAGGLIVGGAAAAGGYHWVTDGPGAPPGTPHELRIATGPPGGVFREIGSALAAVLTDLLPGTRIRLLTTGASVDNLRLLHTGDADLGLAAVDTIADAVTRVDRPDLAAVARLFDSWMQVLVPADSSVTRFAQLDGAPVAAGAAGSGTRFGLLRLAGAVGVLPDLVTASQDAGAQALVAGRVAAFVTFTGVPTPAVRRLAGERRVRLLSLAGETSSMISQFGDVYTAATLPSTAYPQVAGAATMTTPNLLLVTPNLSTALVRAITGALFSQRDRIARDHPEAEQINIRTGAGTMPVRLHPGARQYFRDVKP